MPCRSEIEIRPFLAAADLAEFLTPEELSTPHEGTRGKLGVAGLVRVVRSMARGRDDRPRWRFPISTERVDGW